MKPLDPIPKVDLAALAAWKERNRQERLAYVDFKARWLREHAVIPPDKPAQP